MQYRDFGNAGIKVSILGFGAMRLPEEEIKGKHQVKEKESIDIIKDFLPAMFSMLILPFVSRHIT